MCKENREECKHVYGVIDNGRGYDFIYCDTDIEWTIRSMFAFCPRCGIKLNEEDADWYKRQTA